MCFVPQRYTYFSFPENKNRGKFVRTNKFPPIQDERHTPSPSKDYFVQVAPTT